jgi:hypothetical protein
VDRAIAGLAQRQHGVVTLGQLRELGLSKTSVYERVDGGRLHLVAPAIFAVGHAALSVDGRRLAAVLSLGDDAVLSHLSAAVAWGLLDHDGTRWNVAVPHSSGGVTGPRQVRPRRTRRLLPEDRTVLRGIPITTVARTLVDVAGEQRGRYVQRAVHEAEVLRLLDVAAVLETIERNPGRRGVRLLRHALGVSVPDPTNSRFAAEFGRLCTRHGLPAPKLGVHRDIGERLAECDAVFDDARLIVELDSERIHNTRRRFHSDRRRDAAAAAQGWLVVRLTWRRVTREGPEVAAQIRQILALRGMGPSGPA